MTKRRGNPELDKEASAFAGFPVIEGVDPRVVIPADVRARVLQADAAACSANRRRSNGLVESLLPDFRSAVTDQDVQDARDECLDSLEAAGKGKRQQPRMIDRLRAVDVFVRREMADGTPFAVGRNSLMNRKVREWLNARAARTTDERKSRSKRITADAVRGLLRQVRDHLGVD
jgi:hypothetical protein